MKGELKRGRSGGRAKLLVTWVYLWITMSWKEENQSCKMTLQGLSGLFTECKVCLVSILMPNADLCPLHSSLLQVQHFCKCFNIIGSFCRFHTLQSAQSTLHIHYAHPIPRVSAFFILSTHSDLFYTFPLISIIALN